MLGLLLAAAVQVCAVAATLPKADTIGSRDHAQLKRYEGAVILSYSQQGFAEFALPLASLQAVPGRRDAKNNQYFEPAQKKTLEGRYTRLVYLIPPDRSPLEVSRNYRDEIVAAGGAAVFECAGEDCGGEAGSSSSGGGGSMSLSMFLHPEKSITDAYASAAWCAQTEYINDQRYLAAELPASGVDVSVLTYLISAPDVGDTCGALNNRTIAVVDIVEAKAREQKMVTVSASQMASAIAGSGSVALYGIYFDFNQAVIKPESEATLVEIAKFLATEAALNVLIVGHTDNVGSYAFNLDLSKRRAAAVCDALTARYDIARARMTPVGVSFASPVASNQSEDGRAKNRRVALVDAH